MHEKEVGSSSGHFLVLSSGIRIIVVVASHLLRTELRFAGVAAVEPRAGFGYSSHNPLKFRAYHITVFHCYACYRSISRIQRRQKAIDEDSHDATVLGVDL